MSNSGGLNRTRVRANAPTNDQVLTRLGRVAPNPIAIAANPTTVVQNSGTIPSNRNRPINVESETIRLLDSPNIDVVSSIPTITNFDAEQYQTEIKTHSQDEKRLEQAVLNAIYYLVNISKRSAQQMADYTVLTLLSWTASMHGQIFHRDLVIKCMCLILKGSTSTKTNRNISMMNNGNHPSLSTTTYALVCQILWLAFKDKKDWPMDFIEAFVEDALGEQNWIKNNHCHLFVANIQTAFNTRPSTWKIEQTKSIPSTPNTSNPLPTTTDETSNDSNAANSVNNESMLIANNESESSLPTPDENNSITNSDQQSIVARYEGRIQAVQTLLLTLLNNSLKGKGSIGNQSALGVSSASNSSSAIGSNQPNEIEKLLSLLEQLCGLPLIRLEILTRLDIWLQNPKYHHQAEKLMMTLCENLTKNSSSTHSISNGVTNHQQDLSYIDERAIEHLVNLRFKSRVSHSNYKMYTSCIQEMLKHDVNLVDHVVRFIIHNELQQSPTTIALNTTSGKNPNNIKLLQSCSQAQPELTCQSIAYTIQNILLGANVATTSRDYENLLKLIRPFIRELMKPGKQEFDSMKFCMYLVDMHYSPGLQTQLWTMMTSEFAVSSNEITSNRLLKRLLETTMSNRERFLNAICDLIPMIILVSAQSFHLQANRPNLDQRLNFIQRVALIQCCCCLFIWQTLLRVFDSTSTFTVNNYIASLYNILFTAQSSSYLRIETWPSEESLRNDLFRLACEVPILGETLFSLIQIGLTSPFNLSQRIIIDLIDLLVRRTFNVEQKLPADLSSIYLQIPSNSCEIFLNKLFDLTVYIIRKKTQFPSTYRIPTNLVVTEIFWKAILICLLVASHDPSVFGRFVWTSIPQIRLLMEMFLTGDYSCPPNSMIESKEFLDQFRMNERIHLRKEKDLLLELEKYLAAPQLIDETNSQLLGKVILLDLDHMRRPLTHEKNEQAFYHLIQGLNKHYKLSSMLCRCRSPDFILEILNRKDHQGKTMIDNQTSWLTGLIDSNIDCLNVFPIVCLCDYFQHMMMIYRNSSQTILPSNETENALKTILNRFRSLIQTVKHEKDSKSIDDVVSMLNYFFQRLNSNISSIRSNIWSCLQRILDENSSSSMTIDEILSHSNRFESENLPMILSTISQIQSLNLRQLSIIEMLVETCQYETNIFLLHSSLVFLLEHLRSSSNSDCQLLTKLARALIRRHSILYLLMQFDKQEKNYQLTKQLFIWISEDLLEKISLAMKIVEHSSTNESNIETHLVFPPFDDEQMKLLRQIESHLTRRFHFQRSNERDKLSFPFESILIEFLLIFLSSFDENHRSSETISELTNLLQQFFSSASLIKFRRTSIHPQPIRQIQDENHLKQFAVDEDERSMDSSQRKRRLSDENSTNKVFLSSNDVEIEQSLFNSDDVQYFIFKSTNFLLLRQCIDQATVSTCLKMLKISVQSKENIRYVCQRLNHLIDSSSKQIQIYLKQSSFILPILNRWIIEGVPDAIQLGEKMKKFIEKRKRSNSGVSESKSSLIPTTTRQFVSITDQLQRYQREFDEKSTNFTDEHRMETTNLQLNFPWKTFDECEQLLKTFLNNQFDSNQRRQYLIELQWLIHQSETHRNEFLRAFRSSRSTNEILTTLIKTNELTKDSTSNESENEENLFRSFVENDDPSTLGMILDRLEKFDRHGTKSIYAKLLLFSRRIPSTFAQRILLKQFLHSTSWSTILNCISTLLNDRRDSIVILDLLEAFFKLSPLWSGRESKMLERCHDENLLDFNDENLFTLFNLILDEAHRRSNEKKNLLEQFQKRYETILLPLIENRSFVEKSLEKLFLQSSWRKEILLRFYFVLYVNQSNLFFSNSMFNSIFLEFNSIKTNVDEILHELFVRFNQFETSSNENLIEIHRILKFYVSNHPMIFLRHLKMIQLSLQSRLATLTIDEFQRRESKQRTFFFAIFDLIQRAKPLIFDRIYHDEFQSIVELYLRLISTHLSAFNSSNKGNIGASNFLQDFLHFLDEIFKFLYEYFSSTTNDVEHLMKIYQQRLGEKFAEKIQQNVELAQVLIEHKHNQINYHLHQLKILNESMKITETSFDVRLCRETRKFFDIEPYRRKLSQPIDQSMSSVMIEEILFALNDLKGSIDYYLTVEHLTNLLDLFTNYLLTGHKQLMEITYNFILKFIEKSPQHSSIFYESYVKCLLSRQTLVFQMALEYFAHLIIFFQSKSNELFAIVIKQGLMHKIDVTTPITRAIRLLNLHRYEPNNSSSTSMEN